MYLEERKINSPCNLKKKAVELTSLQGAQVLIVLLILFSLCPTIVRPNNMIAQSQSGTGKTAAFVLSMLSRVDATQNFTQVRVGM